MHRILVRQIKKYLGNNIPAIPGWEEFIKSVSDTYDNSDEDRELIERSLEISSKELKEAEARFRQIADAAEEWVWEVNKDGLFTYSNTIVERILGYKPEEVIGKKHFYDFITPDTREELKKQAFEVFDARRVFKNFLNANLHKNGSIVFLETTGAPVLDKEGNLLGYRGVDTDVTERRKSEEELKAAYAKLKETQDQLVQSAKMASIGLLAGGVAHEINNPLTGVLNNVQLIKMIVAKKKDFSIDDFKELLDPIEESARRCSTITRSLLEFSRASRGALQNFSLNEMVEKVIILIEHELKLQNIAVQGELKSDLPQIKGDPQLIQQVIFNIISNAKWSMQKKPGKHGGSIVIKTDYHPAENSISLEISDTGVGISKENLDKIFDPFFTTKQVGEGTGLGLSIVYNIIKEHNGMITVDSDVDKGTTFKILLPAYK